MSTSRSLRARGARHALAPSVGLAVALAAAGARAQETPPAPPPAPAPAPGGDYVWTPRQSPQPAYPPQGVALSGPAAVRPYEPGAPIPPGYHPAERVRSGLIIGGAITFGVTYTLTSLAGAIITDVNRGEPNGESGRALFVPVLGPFLQISRTESAVGDWTLATIGLAQAGGAAMLIVGLTVPKTVLVRNDLAEVRLAPMGVGQRGTGLGLVGSF